MTRTCTSKRPPLRNTAGRTPIQEIFHEHVSTEMSLHVLAYNLKRVMRIMGVVPLMEAIAE